MEAGKIVTKREDSHEFREVFQNKVKNRCVLFLRTLSLLAALLFPLFGILDRIVYPDSALKLYVIRLSLLPIFFIVFLLTHNRFISSYIHILGSTAFQIAAAAISLMVFYTGGAESHYYAGLILIQMSMFAVMPWHPLISFANGLGMYIGYLLSIYFHNSVAINFMILTSNSYFILGTLFIGTFWSVTGYRLLKKETLAQDALENANKQLNEYIRIIDHNVLTSSADLTGKITYASEAFCNITGYTEMELLGKNHNIVRHPNVSSETYKELWETIQSGKTWRGELINKKKDGSDYWVAVTISPTFDDLKNIIGYTAIRQDITDKKIIEEISITDALTNLYNRRYFNQIFPRELQRAKRENVSIAFLMLDVDFFKRYNDHYGHQKGDQALQKIGDVLNNLTRRGSDFAFRFGGEEFAVLICNTDKIRAMDYAEEIRRAIEALKIEHETNSPSNCITVSGGISVISPEENLSADEIIKKSDDLLYLAKDSGRNCIK